MEPPHLSCSRDPEGAPAHKERAGAMLLELLQKANLFHLLHQIDLDFSEQHRRQGCPYCGGPLHRASYERKPRGGPETIPEAFCIRLSLCCGRRDCRRRSLPPSCLFMGRRVYWGAVVLVVITLRQQRCSGASASKLRNLLDISHKTLVRWMRYFREAFPTSSQWQRLRGLVPATVGNSEAS